MFNNLKFEYMTNLLFLMIVIVAFMSLMVVVTYLADTLAVAFVKWLGLEGSEK